jgi:predicted HicB family RNase H-like nuclease
MKKVTVSLDFEIYRHAHMAAAERGASLSALVERFLMQMVRTR